MFECKFPRQSNAADFIYTVHVENKTTGSAYDLTDAVIYLSLDGPRRCSGITANSADGSEIVSVLDPATDGDIAIVIPADRFKNLIPDIYCLGLLMVEGDQKTQILLSELPIVEGLPKWL